MSISVVVFCGLSVLRLQCSGRPAFSRVCMTFDIARSTCWLSIDPTIRFGKKVARWLNLV